MNRIEVVDNKIIVDVDSDIEYKTIDELEDVKVIKLKIVKDTSLFIEHNYNECAKMEVIVELKDFSKLNLYEIKSGPSLKLRTKYILNEESILNVYKFNDVDEVKENIVINLNGKNSKVNYIFKTIAIDKEKYDLVIYHNACNTQSYIKNNGVANKKGKLTFNVSSFVPNGNKECNVNQINRIINLTNNKCKIEPNLYIDEYDVSANHSALIGKFSDSELFYLQSRGIDEKDALMLLIKGFILSGIDFEQFQKLVSKKISKYWR